MANQKEDVVRVLRIIEYIGPRSWVENTVTRSIHGKRMINADSSITVVTLTEYPEILEQALEQEKESN